ncbi:MAG TPA: glycosyltransferase family 4 protein, partial [bacterium]|nr:glycosyltransferase family 4 protein [bacterium]
FNARQDTEALAAMAPSAAGRLHTAANGVDAGAFRRPSAAQPRGKSLVFVGQLAYPPNSEAVLWFSRKVLPLLRAQDPDLVFEVVGGGAPAALRALDGQPGLRFTGFVADTRPRLWSAAVSVCPVRSGAGRQNKLLEAFAAGTPCVATPLAAAGAEAEHGRHLLVAQEPAAFAEAVLRLCRQPALGRRLARQAADLLARHYRWEANAGALERTMTRAARRPLW